MGRRRADIDADGHESARVAKAVARAEQDVESVQTRMRAVVKYLNDRHIDVGEDGTLKIRPGFEDDPDAKKALEQQAKTGNGLTVSEIMADADRVDEELAAAMRAAVGDEQLDENGRPIPGTQHAPATPPPGSLKGDELNNILQKSGSIHSRRTKRPPTLRNSTRPWIPSVLPTPRKGRPSSPRPLSKAAATATNTALLKAALTLRTAISSTITVPRMETKAQKTLSNTKGAERSRSPARMATPP